MRFEGSTRDRCKAFTLVELLVVIGIIALLISILLPALNSARRQANAVKCSTQLRELGNCYRFYANDNHGYYPPALLRTTSTSVVYTLDNIDFNSTKNAYWYNFINRYVSKNNLGKGSTNAVEQGEVRGHSVVWGCSEWDAFTSTTAGDNGINQVQTGYGYNYMPTFTNDYPAPGATPGMDATQTQLVPFTGELATSPDAGWSPATPGVFMKASVWNRHGAERMLLSDARFYIAQSEPVPATGILPLQPGNTKSIFFTSGVTTGETIVSLWRHTKFPAEQKRTSAGSYYDPTHSKISYNILYCDGHVVTSTDPKEAFRSVRMKFPG